MDNLTATAASGMRSRIEALDLLANNISNTSTAGYKSDREFYGLYASADAETQSTMPNIERNWIDFSQGIVKDTGNPLDVALAGPGVPTAGSPGRPRYTRKRSLRLASAGRLPAAGASPMPSRTPI